jgi:hypothetical protein
LESGDKGCESHPLLSLTWLHAHREVELTVENPSCEI